MKTRWVYGTFLAVWLGAMAQASALLSDIRLAEPLNPDVSNNLSYNVLPEKDFTERTLRALQLMKESLEQPPGTIVSKKQKYIEQDYQTLLRTVASLMKQRRHNPQVQIIDELLEKFFRESGRTEWSDKYEYFDKLVNHPASKNLKHEPLVQSARVLFNAINLQDLLQRKAQENAWKRTATIVEEAVIQDVSWLEKGIKAKLFTVGHSTIEHYTRDHVLQKRLEERERAFEFAATVMGAAVDGSNHTQQKQLQKILEAVDAKARPDVAYNRSIEDVMQSYHLDRVQKIATWTSNTILGASLLAIGAAWVVTNWNGLGGYIGAEIPSGYVDLAQNTLQWASEHFAAGAAVVATRVATILPRAAEKAKNIWLRMTKRKKTPVLSTVYRASLKCEQLFEDHLDEQVQQLEPQKMTEERSDEAAQQLEWQN